MITLSSALPALTVPVVIDASTQTGGTVEINGKAIVDAIGLDIAGGKSVVRGLVMTDFTGDNTAALPVFRRQRWEHRCR